MGSFRVAILTAVLLLGATIALLAWPSEDAPSPTGSSPTGTVRADTVSSISLKDIQYQPAELSVAIGGTVTWRNDDPVAHTVTPTDKTLWGSQGSGDDEADWLQPGETWTFTFTKPGTYVYYCIPHAGQGSDGVWRGMVGTIVVGASLAPPVAFSMPNASVVPSPIAPARTLPAADGMVHLALETKEVNARLADGTAYKYWTFNGTVPGPMLRVRVNDTVMLTLSNAGDSGQVHSIDLHAVTGPGGGAVVTQAKPGETRAFTFKAVNPGLYVYHCASPHIPSHIANGMYGLILVEPEGGLPPVEREFYVVQGEIYATGTLNEKGQQTLSLAKLLDERPEYYVLNGALGALTGDGALKANVGDRVRIYFGVGAFVPSSFHVIGEIFDRVYPEAGFPGVDNVQTTLVPAGGATMVEFKVEVPGNYILVDHTLTHAIDRGAVGILTVSGAPDTSVFNGEPTPGSGH